MIEKEFNPDVLYGKIVHYYMDRRGYDKAKANAIAQRVVQREAQRRICTTEGCGHFSHDHLRNTGICLSDGCTCSKFTNRLGMRAGFAKGKGKEAGASGVTMAAAAAMTDSGMQAGKNNQHLV